MMHITVMQKEAPLTYPTYNKPWTKRCFVIAWTSSTVGLGREQTRRRTTTKLQKNTLTFGLFPSVVLCWVHQFSVAVSCVFVLEGGGWSLLVQGPASRNTIEQATHIIRTAELTYPTDGQSSLEAGWTFWKPLLDTQLYKRPQQNKCMFLLPDGTHSFKVLSASCKSWLTNVSQNL